MDVMGTVGVVLVIVAVFAATVLPQGATSLSKTAAAWLAAAWVLALVFILVGAGLTISWALWGSHH